MGKKSSSKDRMRQQLATQETNHALDVVESSQVASSSSTSRSGQSRLTADVLAQSGIAVGLLDPIWVYVDPSSVDGSHHSIHHLLNNDSNFRAFMEKNLKTCGLTWNDIENVSILPTVPHATSIDQWRTQVGDNEKTQLPTVAYYLKRGQSRSNLFFKYVMSEDERIRASKERDTLAEKNQNTALLALLSEIKIQNTLEFKDIKKQLEEWNKKMEERDKKLEEWNKKMEERDKNMEERDSQLLAAINQIQSDNKKWQERHDAALEASIPLRHLRTRQLLEMFRNHLKEKYNLNDDHGINAEIETLHSSNECDPAIRPLLKFAKSGFLYSHISENHIHSTPTESELAAVICAVPDSENRTALLAIFELLFGCSATSDKHWGA